MKRLQDKLVQAEKLSALGRLTSDVAHEIRNPLTVVGGFARRLAKRLPEGAREKEYAGIIVSEAGKTYADLCRERRILLAVEAGSSLPSCIVDRDQVRQAVNNLVQNAIDAMPAGGA